MKITSKKVSLFLIFILLTSIFLYSTSYSIPNENFTVHYIDAIKNGNIDEFNKILKKENIEEWDILL